MTITINGKTVEPVFNFGTLRRIGELTKKDPFTLQIDTNKPDEIYKYVYLIVHAGLLSAKVIVNEKQVQDVIDDWSLAEAMAVINEFKQAFEVEPKPGEEINPQ